ncbi:MAG: DUF3168 domain-containing protein [Rhodocyclaceae bacterium]|nr:DUF3168 domain-containing protein [Rhodocyclaceae bacterium]
MSGELVVKALLENSAGVGALVAGRLYSLHRPEADVLPAIVWVEVSDVPRPPIDSTPGSEPCIGRVQINCLGRSSAEVKQLKDAVVSACHKQSGTIAGITVQAVLEDVAGPRTYDPLVDTYQQSVDVIVYYIR